MKDHQLQKCTVDGLKADSLTTNSCGFMLLIQIKAITLCIVKGHELLSELQQRRFNGSDGGVSWSPMDDELLAQPQVMKLLDSLREQYTRYQEVCRQRSKRTQLEEIQQKVMQVSSELCLNALRGTLSSSPRLRFLQKIGGESVTPPVTSQMSSEVCQFHSVLYIVAAMVTFQRLF